MTTVVLHKVMLAGEGCFVTDIEQVQTAKKLFTFR